MIRLQSWHWPVSDRPQCSYGVLLEQIRERSAPLYFAREYLAEWVDEAGSFFTTQELEAALGCLRAGRSGRGSGGLPSRPVVWLAVWIGVVVGTANAFLPVLPRRHGRSWTSVGGECLASRGWRSGSTRRL